MSELAQAPQQSTFPKSVQPGVPKLKPAPKGWQTYKFGQLFDVVQRPITLHDDQEYDLVTVKRARGGIERRATRLYGSEISVKSQFALKEGDFLISKRQIVHGACGIVSAQFENSIVSNEYSTLRCKSELDLSFLGYLTFSIYFQQTCFHSSVGVHVEKMIFKLEDWFKWPINIPTLAEQKKIAAFLSAVDAKLDALRRKRLALNRYKAGLMQQLFSKTLRFTRPDGTAFPDWEDKHFGQLYDFIATNSLSRDALSYGEGEIQNIHYGDIHTRFRSQFRQDQEQIPFIRPEFMPDKFDQNQFCRTGDIVIADASEDYADIGKAIEIISVRDKSLVAGLHTFLARPKSNDTVVGYSGYLLQTFAMRRQIMRIAQGISVLGISKPKLAKLSVPLPQRDEQRKIADALAAIDAKIQAVVGQISKMEVFKKGLLQQIFV